MAVSRPGRSTPAVFAGVIVIAGVNFVAVRFSNFELPPFWGAALRFSSASLLFFLIVIIRGLPLPRGRGLLGAALYGALAFGASFALAYYGLVSVKAGLASVILGMVPLTTFLLAFLHRLEPFRWQGLFGALVAVVGIAIVFQEQLTAAVPLASLLALLAATASIAESNIVVKWFPRSNPFSTNAVAMAVGTIILVTLSTVTHEVWSIPARPATLIAITYLVSIGSVLLFAGYLFVIARWTASAASYQFVVSPLVTVVAAALLAGETVTIPFIAGAALVLMGVYVGSLFRPKKMVPSSR